MKKFIIYSLLLGIIAYDLATGQSIYSIALGPLVIPAIGAGASLLSQGFNALSTSGANRASEDFQRSMYERQRKDALTDWDKQNQYNSPLATMERFKDAGLNPNLIYGQGTQASTPVRTASPGSYRAEAPKLDLGDALSAFVKVMLDQTQISNQEKLLELREKELQMKNLKFDIDEQTKFTTIESREQALRNLRQQHTNMDESNARAWIAQGLDKNRTEAQIALMNLEGKAKEQGIRQSEQYIENLKAQRRLTDKQVSQVDALIQNLYRSGSIQDFQIQLNKLYIERKVSEKIFDKVIDVAGTIIGARVGRR